MATKKKRWGRIITVGFLIVLTIYFVTTMVGIVNTYQEKRREIAQTEEQIEETQVLKQEYQDLIDQGVDDEYIQKLAREKLGLVYSDERVYIDMAGG